MKDIMSDIHENLRKIRGRIERAAAQCGRAPGDIALLAISKTFPIETISIAIAAGQRLFGENRLQEAESKIPRLRAISGLEWHLVGHLQSNKAHKAAQLFDVIHSVDSVKVAAKLSQSCLETGKQMPVLLQVDLGQELTKSGIEPADVRSIMESITTLRGIRVDGLMAIPPYFENPESTRPYFVALRKLLEALESEQPGCLG